MSVVGFLFITCLVMLPLMTGWRRKLHAAPVGERESALQLYRGQLQDLDRDVASGLLPAEERDRARLEIQRRLLVADGQAERIWSGQTRSRLRILLLVCLLTTGGTALYLVNGHPSLPPQPHTATARPIPAGMQALFDKLEKQVSTLSPTDPAYVSQSVLLGQVEEALNRTDDAIRSYRQALAVRFLPELAIQIAELQSRRDGRISADSLALYRKALDEAPADAPWRLAVEARIAAGEHETPR